MERLALDQAHRLQIEAERERRARADAELHVLPVFPRGVVDDGPGLEADLPPLPEDDSIARLPRGRLGHVRDAEIMRPRALQADLHVDEAIVRARRLRGIRDGRGLARVGVDDREGLEEIIDLVGGDLELQRVAIHARRPLEIGDPVAIDDDAAERRVGVDEGRRGAAAGERGQAREKKERSHGCPCRGRGERPWTIAARVGSRRRGPAQRSRARRAYTGAPRGLTRARGRPRAAPALWPRSSAARPRRRAAPARRRSAGAQRAPSAPRGGR